MMMFLLWKAKFLSLSANCTISKNMINYSQNQKHGKGRICIYERIWANWQDFVEKLDIYPMIRPYLETSQITIHEVPAKTCISNAADEGYRIVYILQGSVKVVSLT